MPFLQHGASRPNQESVPVGTLTGELRHGDAQTSTQAKARCNYA